MPTRPHLKPGFSATLRVLAVALVRYAANGLAPSWSRIMQREVHLIEGGVESLIWAIGCVWALRVERFIRRPRPALNCALFFIGLCITLRYLLTHLSWYGMAPAQPNFDMPPRGLLKLFIFFCLIAVVAVATPGHRSRRVFAALAFPFYGLLGLLSVATGFQVVKALMAPQGSLAAQIILCGPIFGVVVAALLSLPGVLLYRATATPLAVLALVPAISRKVGSGGRPALDPHPFVSLFEHLWPFICSFIILAIFCDVCRRWVTRQPGESGRVSSA